MLHIPPRILLFSISAYLLISLLFLSGWFPGLSTDHSAVQSQRHLSSRFRVSNLIEKVLRTEADPANLQRKLQVLEEDMAALRDREALLESDLAGLDGLLQRALRETVQMDKEQQGQEQTLSLVDENVHAFYYTWWGNPSHDGNYIHWQHPVLDASKRMIVPPADLASTYYPSLGPYSSKDPETIRNHFARLAKAHVGTLITTWWGESDKDENGEPGMSDRVVPLLLDIAAEYGLRIGFHIEPYQGRSPETVARDIRYIYRQYGSHSQFLPWFYLYDSYLTPASQWSSILSRSGSPSTGNSLRAAFPDAVFIGLLVEQRHREEIVQAGFDGFYTYFASDGFVYGSTWSHWSELAAFARQQNLRFVPCVGPGYDDEKIRPWNSRNTKSRGAHGEYYRESWANALETGSPVVGLTSFNEWHEGTQIEDAAVAVREGTAGASSPGKFKDYGADNPPSLYVDITAEVILERRLRAKASKSRTSAN